MALISKLGNIEMKFIRNALASFVLVSFLFLLSACSTQTAKSKWPQKTLYKYQMVDGQRIFYREAGNPETPTIILLHGYPSSSHSYRELIPLLSSRYHIIAPDYLGSGYSSKPNPQKTTYSFDLLAKYVEGLITELKIKKYVIYMQDFGAPVGYRVILKNPNNVSGLIVQNANAYLDGLTPKRQAFFKKANQDRSDKHLKKLYSYTGKKGIINGQYLRDVKGKEDIMSPDSWHHDLRFLRQKSERQIQVQLFQDYDNNLLAYPKWQQYLKQYQPPTLIVWGKNDPAFIAAGAKAYLKDLPNAELHLIDAGHFAVEEKPVEIAKYIVQFMQALPK